MAQVYSVRFIAIRGLTGSFDVTVPPDFVFILRDLDCYANTLGVANLYLHGNEGQTIWWQTWEPTVAQYGSWRGRQVMYEGEVFSVTADVGIGDSIDVTVSGYQLSALPG